MKKVKLFFIKYTIVTILIIGAFTFLFIKTLPKSTNVVKKEFVEDVLKFSSKMQENDTCKIVANADSTFDNKENGEIVIPIEVNNNETLVMAEVNGVKMKFVLDTGCSDMQITSAEYYYMKHLGLISDKELGDKITCTYADNSQGECHTINLSKINICGVEIRNITATIQENVNASLLLGQRILMKLGKVTIDYEGNKIIIKKNC